MARVGTMLLGAALAATVAAAGIAAAQKPGGGDQVKAGVDAWEAGNYTKAVGIWRPLADAGDADAQFNLAQAYRLGRGGPVDMKQAEGWYRKAAAQGHAQAQANFGLLLFQNGSRKEALPWLQKAADAGDPRAQYVVGTALFNGDQLPKDWVRAYALMTRAAAAGLPPATSSLTEMDRYIPLDQRQKGTALARELERSGRMADAGPMPMDPPPVAATMSPPSPSAGIRPTELPPRARGGPPGHQADGQHAAAGRDSPSASAPAPASRAAGVGDGIAGARTRARACGRRQVAGAARRVRQRGVGAQPVEHGARPLRRVAALFRAGRQHGPPSGRARSPARRQQTRPALPRAAPPASPPPRSSDSAVNRIFGRNV